jgi:uncharacterized 2Fe-2S/4Fe-4S cluster protein (DUF4445 family)
MTPVISPWVFYLMPICDNIGIICSIFGVLAAIAAIAVCITCTVEEHDRYSDEDFVKSLKAFRKILVPVATVLVTLSIFIPSEKTITKMLIAQNVTYERVEAATDTVQSVYEDIMDLFEEDDE